MKRKTRTSRASSRRNKRKRGLFLKLLLTMVVIGVIGISIYVSKKSRLFELQEIEFYGNKHLTAKNLKSLMGIYGGENLLYLRSRTVAKNLTVSPWINEVSVRKEFFHRLLVKVEEATPAALLQKKGEMYLVDADGQILEKVDGLPESFLPIVMCSKPENDPMAFKEAVQLAMVINETGLSKEKKSIEITGVEDGLQKLSMRLDGLLVKLGNGQYREKLTRLFELSDEIRKKAQSIEYVDLRFENRVVVKPIREMVR